MASEPFAPAPPAADAARPRRPRRRFWGGKSSH
jgi:hypothetical protein